MVRTSTTYTFYKSIPNIYRNMKYIFYPPICKFAVLWASAKEEQEVGAHKIETP